jgi:BirA family biotin operon repressor/biotin-[acetyl-CoA-carboxylase] ligase
MQLIDGNTATHGLAILAGEQTQGKGQRGRVWASEPGQNLLLSIIVTPTVGLTAQFSFNAMICVAITNVLQKLCAGCRLAIKWPNDIIVNDKKAGGILIENVVRGNVWTHAIIGIGINVLQTDFDGLPHATSLKIASGLNHNLEELALLLRSQILQALSVGPAGVLEKYNALLYKRGELQLFTGGLDDRVEARIAKACTDGTLEVQHADGSIQHLKHGVLTWVYN